MEKIRKQINDAKVNIGMSLIEALELKNLLDKDVMRDAVPTDKGCRCPNCGTDLVKDAHHCHHCGQRVYYKESDVIPL